MKRNRATVSGHGQIAELPDDTYAIIEPLVDEGLIVWCAARAYRLADGVMWERANEMLARHGWPRLVPHPIEAHPTSDWMERVRSQTFGTLERVREIIALQNKRALLVEEMLYAVSTLPVSRVCEAVNARHPGVSLAVGISSPQNWPFPTVYDEPPTERLENGWVIVRDTPGLLLRVQDLRTGDHLWLWLTPELRVFTSPDFRRPKLGKELYQEHMIEEHIKRALPNVDWAQAAPAQP